MFRYNVFRVRIHLSIDHSSANPALQRLAEWTNKTDFRDFQVVKDVHSYHGAIFL
jgi:hypothetical protein